MQKIRTHLWFDREAGEAAEFYTAVFGGSGISRTATLHNTPSGSADIVVIHLLGQEFQLISAGPYFKFTPAVSFLVACGSTAEVDGLWARLLDGGSILMKLGEYPFSTRYGWLQEKFGLSWQLMFMGERSVKQRITPTLMFSGKNCGRAEEALRFYASLHPKSRVGDILRYGRDEAPDVEGTVKHAAFELEGQSFAAMDSARVHNAGFNEAISFMVLCDTQEEIDRLWRALSADPAAEQCGWLKDKYGLSWQIVPSVMDSMLVDRDPRKLARVTEAFLSMKKFDVQRLERAYAGS
jgi:predicted 3-demethylubiquinone-9 3-methyltransferase (glyoxalase superfamily)